MTNHNLKFIKPKILITDDDISTRMLLRASITQWDFKVVEANDGEEAFRILQGDDPPLIVLLDWMMPKLDGIGLCKRITQTLGRRPYIILLTHTKGTTHLLHAVEAGADEFIEKPINLEELRCRLTVATRIIHGEYTTLKQIDLNDKY